MERMILMLNLVSAVILLVAAAYMQITFAMLLSDLARGTIGTAVLVYFFYTVERLASSMVTETALVSGSGS